MNRENIPEELLRDVENYLDVTWSDPNTDKKISGLIAAGAAYLDSKLSQPANYEQDGLPRTLLFEYVRYARDSALDVFENNFQPLILAAQHEGLVSENAVESAIQATNG